MMMMMNNNYEGNNDGNITVNNDVTERERASERTASFHRC